MCTEFLRLTTQSLLFSSQNAVYFILLFFLVHKILICYINDVVKCKCPDAMPKG